jgi:hypothetical protein
MINPREKINLPANLQVCEYTGINNPLETNGMCLRRSVDQNGFSSVAVDR